MKHARHMGRRVKAAPGAPVKAICPDCQGDVTLRSRDGQFEQPATYFYCHIRGAPLNCSKRGYYRKPLVAPVIVVPVASLYKLRMGRSWYNILVETGMLSVFRVTRTWGRGGIISKGLSVTKDLTSRQDAEGCAQYHVLRLIRKGYALVEWL